MAAVNVGDRFSQWAWSIVWAVAPQPNKNKVMNRLNFGLKKNSW